VWLAVIFSFSSLSGSPYPYDPPVWYYLERKSAHVIEYAVLMALAVRFWYAVYPRETFTKILLLAAAFSIAYGATDELHQFFTPYRGAKVTDILVDCLGAFSIALLYYFISHRKNR
jgi:VanZ family protein